MLRLTDLRGRAALADLLNQRKLTEMAVEIGVHRGEFARQFMNRWKGKRFFAVDHYPTGYDKADPASAGDREADKREAFNALFPFLPNDRVQFIYDPSYQAAMRFDDCTLDFVYIDACHQYDNVVEDLEAWWPKVRHGGILAGHDFFCPVENGKWEKTVQKAVIEFSGYNSLPVWLISEQPYLMETWSYYFEKP